MTRLRRFIDVAAGVGLVVLASAGYHRVFDGWTFLARFGATAVVGAALVALFTRGSLPRPWAAAALVVAFVPVQMFLALGDTLTAGLPTADTASGLWDGLTRGWADALNDFLPLADPSPVTVLLVALVYAASVATTLLTLHTDRVVPVVVPSLVLYAISLPLAAPAAEAAVWLTGVLILAVLAVILLRANPGVSGRTASVAKADADFQPHRRLGRIVLIGGSMVVAAALVGLGVAELVGSDDPFDPRDQRSEQVDDRLAANPLDEFKSVAGQDPPELAFELTILGGGDLGSIDRVTSAVMDEYDGREWRTSDRFEEYDEFLPDDASLRADRQSLTLSLSGLSTSLGPYLPVVGRPRQIVDQSPVQFGRASGTVLAPNNLGSEPVVEVTELVLVSDADELNPDTDTEFDQLRTLPAGISTAIPDLAGAVTADSAAPSDQLRALERYLESETRFDADAPSGYSAGQVEAFLAGDEPGNAVHYATAMALLARSVGYPARVVVGWPLPDELPAGTTSVELTSADYHVWSEVRLADGLGWQAVAVQPTESAEPNIENAPGTTVPAGQLGGVRPAPSQAEPGQLLPEAETDSSGLSPWLVPLVLVGFVALWAVVFGVLIVLAKRRRRRLRRRAPTPSERIQGAWVDSGDRLVETGVGVHPELTLTETVNAGSVRLGDATVDALRQLVPEVGACAYAQDPPSAQAAERAWVLADEFRHDLSSSRSLARSAVATLNPRPLLRSRGR